VGICGSSGARTRCFSELRKCSRTEQESVLHALRIERTRVYTRFAEAYTGLHQTAIAVPALPALRSSWGDKTRSPARMQAKMTHSMAGGDADFLPATACQDGGTGGTLDRKCREDRSRAQPAEHVMELLQVHAIVTRVPRASALNECLNRIRRALVPACRPRAHVTLIPGWAARC
jgi:hypothetical protein